MSKWRLLEGPLTALNTVLDEILNLAVFVQQAVPWLLAAPPDRTLR